MQKANVSEKEALSVALLAEGDFAVAQQMLHQGESDNAKLFLDWMRKCYQGNGVELVHWVDSFSSLGREKQKYFVQYALHFLREYLVLKMTGGGKVRLLDNELKTASNLTKIIEWEQAEGLISLLNDSFYYIERNANPKILFLDVSINMHKILRKKVLTN
jgi:DNA polymerase-3 subunit delta'